MRIVQSILKNKKAILWIFCAASIGFFMVSHITVTLTPSLAHRIFWIGPKPEGGVRLHGKYVLFKLPANPFLVNPKTEWTIKRVGCEPGERLEVNSKDEYFCNGVLIGTAKRSTLKGEKVDPFVFNGTIRANELFVVGDHKDSYDSRYFGFLEKYNVKSIVYPIL